uniref:Ig-like domain-containing protein n=1 Tax=Xiphophorus maculatus TaxID=8083 RepID=A0A3B5QVV2_XIPMA
TVLLLLLLPVSFAARGLSTNITAEVGQETFLPCRSPDNKPVIAVEWIRSDLGSEYVLLYRNRKINLENQHVMFKDRVDLQDRQMKDGNVSLVLKNVTTDDRGAYECRIIQTETNSRTETVFIINLDVLLPPPGELMSACTNVAPLKRTKKTSKVFAFVIFHVTKCLVVVKTRNNKNEQKANREKLMNTKNF